jgi:hypothetical protein
MGKKSSQKQQVYDYLLSMHIGICHGPVDAIEKIYIGEKEAYSSTVTASSEATVNLPELFGGVAKEGGVAGKISFLFGEATQVLSSALAAKLGGTPATIPGFRGITSLFFSGTTFAGFKWGTNSSFIKPVSVRVRRSSPGLDAAKQMIGPDSNPANIIYECLTNPIWGAGRSVTELDLDSFTAAQSTLFTENFGLTMIWNRPTSIEDFILEVLKHVGGLLFLNPVTALLELRLIRGGYSTVGVKQFNPDNCTKESLQTKMWGETINEIVVTWTNPANEQEETITLQDIGNIATQGGVISESRDYYGIRNAALATFVGSRDLRQISVPLVTASISADRSAWDVTPGSIVSFSWPEDGVTQIYMRVMSVDYGKKKNSPIKMQLAQDIFSLAASQYDPPPTSQWVDSSAPPQAITLHKEITIPYYWAERVGDAAFPETSTVILASPPNSDTFNFDLHAETPNDAGVLSYPLQTTMQTVGTALLTSPLVFGVSSSNVALGSLIGIEPVAEGTFILIGDPATDEALCEFAFVTGAGITGTWNLRRGVLDTIPRAWPAGTRVWFFTSDDAVFDVGAVRSVGSSINYKFAPRTTQGILDIAVAPIVTFTPTDRSYLPIRPANVIVAGATNGSVTLPPAATDFSVSWANRNRLAESSPPQAWDGATTTPEAGQTTIVRIRQTNNTLISNIPVASGTSTAVTLAALGGATTFKVMVLSVRDGFESLQNQEITVTV